MKKEPASKSAFFHPRVLASFAFCVLLALGVARPVSLARPAVSASSTNTIDGHSAAVPFVSDTQVAAPDNKATQSEQEPEPNVLGAILYHQSDNAATTSTVSQFFEPAHVAFSAQVVDDFVVPAGQIWTVQQVVVTGVYFNGAGPATSFNVFFYADAASLPGAVLVGGAQLNAAFTHAAGVFTITLPTNLVLTAGTYWVSVQANLNFASGGEWGWMDRTVTSNSGAAAQNPGGGFAAGCRTYTRKPIFITTAMGPDNVFQILGTTGGASPPPAPSGIPSPTRSPVITESSAQTITAGNLVSSNDGVAHTDNSYGRAFNMATFTGSAQSNITVAPTPLPTTTPCSGTAFAENFDGVVPPALPAGWSSTLVVGDPPAWVTSTTTPDTSPNDAFVNDQDGISDKILDSPGIAITTTTAQLSFRNNYNTEHDPPPAEVFWDGGVLEVSTNGGATYSDIIAAGGVFVTGGYTGEINRTANNPLAGRMAWSGNSGGYIDTRINLPASFNGQTIKLRWRMGTDEAVAAPGWRIDTIVITSGACPSPTVTPATPSPSPTCAPLAEGFDDITTLTGAGWARLNHSTVVGNTSWFQGNDTVFPSQSGAPDSYIGANFNNTNGANTISNWLLTPPLILQNGATMTFYTRTVDVPTFPDRLQVRMSTNGASINVGTTATDVGDFSILMLDINPTYTTTGYPNVWTQFSVTVAGLPAPTVGRLAFRYFVENGGQSGANSDYIGIDTFQFNRVCGPTPTPSGTPTPTSTPVTPTPTPATPTPTPTVTPATPTPTPTVTPATPTPTPTVTPATPTPNDNWQDNPAQAAELMAAGLAPTNQLESGIAATLPPGLYTALLAGLNNGTGVGLVEVYDRGGP